MCQMSASESTLNVAHDTLCLIFLQKYETHCISSVLKKVYCPKFFNAENSKAFLKNLYAYLVYLVYFETCYIRSIYNLRKLKAFRSDLNFMESTDCQNKCTRSLNISIIQKGEVQQLKVTKIQRVILYFSQIRFLWAAMKHIMFEQVGDDITTVFIFDVKMMPQFDRQHEQDSCQIN